MSALPNVYLEKADHIARALAWYEHGMDLADALHLALATGADGLVTFDARFLKSVAAESCRPSS